MTPNLPNEATPGGRKGGWNWWRMVFPFKRRASGGQLAEATTTPARSPAAVVVAAAPHRTRSKAGVWLESTWMTTAPLRSKWRWGSLSYIATTWEESSPCLIMSSDTKVASSPTRAKADLDGSVGDDDARPRCNTSGQGQEKHATSIGASRVPALLRGRVPQGLFVGAAIVAATVYVIYRIRRKRRGSRQRNGRPRRRWWYLAGCGAARGNYGRGGDGRGEDCGGGDGSDGDCGGGVNGDRRGGGRDDINPNPSPDPDHDDAELILNSPEVRDRTGCSDAPTAGYRPELLVNAPEVDERTGCGGEPATERGVSSLEISGHAGCTDGPVPGRRVEHKVSSHEGGERTGCSAEPAFEEITERRMSTHDADERAGCSDDPASRERVEHRRSSPTGGKHNGRGDGPASEARREHRMRSLELGERNGCIDGPVSEQTTEDTTSRHVAGSPDLSWTRQLSFKSDSKSDSSTEDLLADVDSLIGATPPSRPSGLRKPPGYRSVTGAEVDALVNLTNRVLRREPDALNQIAESSYSSYKGVAPLRDSEALREIAGGSYKGVGPVAQDELAGGSLSISGMGASMI